MSLTIDGSTSSNSNSRRSGSNFLTNIKTIFTKRPIWVPIFILIVLLMIGTAFYVVIHDENSSRYKVNALVENFIDDFFLYSEGNAEIACQTIVLENSYDSCIAYYNDIYSKEFNDVYFQYEYEILNSKSDVVNVSVNITNVSSEGDNFNYSTIEFSLVKVLNQDRYYTYNNKDYMYRRDWTTEYEMLFQTLELK